MDSAKAEKDFCSFERKRLEIQKIKTSGRTTVARYKKCAGEKEKKCMLGVSPGHIPHQARILTVCANCMRPGHPGQLPSQS